MAMAHTMSSSLSCVHQVAPSSVCSNSPVGRASSSSSKDVVLLGIAPSTYGSAKRRPAMTVSLSSLGGCATALQPARGLGFSQAFHGLGQLAISCPRGGLLPLGQLPGSRCFSTTSSPEEGVVGVPSKESFIRSAMVVMKKGYGAFGGATLEKSKLDLSQSQAKVSPQLEDGGGGGDIGNRNSHGGGDGGDDGGDDDDYFGEDDGGDDGDDGGFFGRRVLVPEIFDRKIVEAVLQEWYMTMSNLPAGIRQAVEMGLISTAQVVRFMSINARPTMTRAIARAVPDEVSRAFVGRVLADPSFVFKVAVEQVTTIGFGVWWEIHHRGSRLKDEWHLAAANILTMSACNAAMVWSLAPSRSYGQTFRFEWQNALQKLPNHAFDMSYPLREFDRTKRVAAFFYKSVELGLIGAAFGAVGAGLQRIVPRPKDQPPSMPIPSVSTSALSYAAFMGLSGNVRYQLLNGLDRVMGQNMNSIGLVIACTTALRVLNIQLGDVSRLSWLGLDQPNYAVEAEGLTKAYHRPSLSPDSVARWVIPKRGVISGFFEEMFNQAKEPKQKQPSNIFAKRKVKRKVTVGR
ncbi:hypothetical protein MPTK1_6g14250 [Marchantia polymorpha subsp. ruderalis]|uniref:Uncharacterized protein n=2 Tax=Marchantia polymorpha TaxID=3197 RepID=A0A176WNF6_MARPO|nr:hypothetical protein AXG93_2891s1480 [Marchantia polymorpha subsp. ruderalis]PTQ39099.1 hypothetical protein MARPO_0047s0079 [Marchantia polymorpha]BBN14756.1 hypothetical protein Mp_6g14250 [Marchantia polymorpha subsp. ruderalis]|eukprot:PTQ39099.1 hypothetical protein MARPO_0047s0079 [Marchantia polymorpha]